MRCYCANLSRTEETEKPLDLRIGEPPLQFLNSSLQLRWSCQTKDCPWALTHSLLFSPLMAGSISSLAHFPKQWTLTFIKFPEDPLARHWWGQKLDELADPIHNALSALACPGFCLQAPSCFLRQPAEPLYLLQAVPRGQPRCWTPGLACPGICLLGTFCEGQLT